MDNDDLDVTKGCEIVVTISHKLFDLEINPIKHKPYTTKINTTTLHIYSGFGVGVVTKDGLKPPKGYPAINPTPLDTLINIFQKYCTNVVYNDIFCSISVIDGEKIAKQTANSKVGVLGGISILGTTGFVKPISSTAYIDSLEQELNFAKANNYKVVVFTLGNSSYQKAIKTIYDDSYIVEIGNFIYDGIKLAIEKKFVDIYLFIGIAKCVKISQGYKNTHNRFGTIDFVKLQKIVDVDISDVVTVKRIKELMDTNSYERFKTIVVQKAINQIKQWFCYDINISIVLS